MERREGGGREGERSGRKEGREGRREEREGGDGGRGWWGGKGRKDPSAGDSDLAGRPAARNHSHRLPGLRRVQITAAGCGPRFLFGITSNTDLVRVHPGRPATRRSCGPGPPVYRDDYRGRGTQSHHLVYVKIHRYLYKSKMVTLPDVERVVGMCVRH